MLCPPPPFGLSSPLFPYILPTQVHLFILTLMQNYLLSVYLVPDPQNQNLRTKSELYMFTFLTPPPPQPLANQEGPDWHPGSPGNRALLTDWLLAVGE